MLGYMLRGFFERYRRHVHWENHAGHAAGPPAPDARTISTALQARMNENRRQAELSPARASRRPPPA